MGMNNGELPLPQLYLFDGCKHRRHAISQHNGGMKARVVALDTELNGLIGVQNRVPENKITSIKFLDA
jgi:hypothetical protein